MDNKSGLGGETTFDFKYIPDLSRTTQKDDGPKIEPDQPGIEWRNLQALIIGCTLFVFVGFYGLRILIFVIKEIRSFNT